MTRIGTLISTLIFLVFASPSHAIVFQFSFSGVEGFLSDLPDNNVGAAFVTVTASPVGGLGVYTGNFDIFFVSNGAIETANFFSVFAGGFFLFLGDAFMIEGMLVNLVQGGGIASSENVTFTPVAETETPIPAALPLFATGLAALGLLGWRRKRKQALSIT